MLSHAPDERAKVTFPFITWNGAFNGPDLDAITLECLRAPQKRAEIMDGSVAEIRKSNLRWVNHSEQTRWMFERMDKVIEDINAWFYGFDLIGYESMQYTEYHANEQGHYGWHMDICLGTKCLPVDMILPRKLSLSLLLNEPGVDYEGGEFQFNMGQEAQPETAPGAKGRIIAFPSWMIHRVTPVTKGVRRSLVIWVVGKKFE